MKEKLTHFLISTSSGGYMKKAWKLENGKKIEVHDCKRRILIGRELIFSKYHFEN